MQRHRVFETVSSVSHRWLAFVLTIVLFSAGSFCHGAEQPNVLMIVVDDMNDWVGCLGGILKFRRRTWIGWLSVVYCLPTRTFLHLSAIHAASV
jgi:hypothetical protein